jgi:hypothetical protein
LRNRRCARRQEASLLIPQITLLINPQVIV